MTMSNPINDFKWSQIVRSNIMHCKIKQREVTESHSLPAQYCWVHNSQAISETKAFCILNELSVCLTELSLLIINVRYLTYMT